jgi:hypothetical protein
MIVKSISKSPLFSQVYHGEQFDFRQAMRRGEQVTNALVIPRTRAAVCYDPFDYRTEEPDEFEVTRRPGRRAWEA